MVSSHFSSFLSYWHHLTQVTPPPSSKHFVPWLPGGHLSWPSSSLPAALSRHLWWFPTISWSLNIRAPRAQPLGFPFSLCELTPEVALCTIYRLMTPRLAFPAGLLPGAPCQVSAICVMVTWAFNELILRTQHSRCWRTTVTPGALGIFVKEIILTVCLIWYSSTWRSYIFNRCASLSHVFSFLIAGFIFIEV